MKTIDTAPRDGTKIKLCAFEDGKAVMCLDGAWDGETWRVSTGGEWSERDGCGPTHWGGGMTDRELLEMAAIAAGLNYNPTIPGDYITYRGYDGGLYTWNPLADDGDALRLLVSLRLWVDVNEGRAVVIVGDSDGELLCEPFAGSAYDATCRAIVRAAAEIGMGAG